MSEDLTTLELASAIAEAALAANTVGSRCVALTHDGPTQAVLRTLRESGSWFCRIEETPEGVTTYQRMPDVQMELFGVSRQE